LEKCRRGLCFSAPASAPASVAPSAAASAPAAYVPQDQACHTSPQFGQTGAGGLAPIEVESWWTTGGESHGLDLLMTAFNAANPTQCAYNAAIAGGSGTVAQGRVKAEVLAGLPPDTFQVHMGHELLDQYVNVATPYVAPLGTDVIDPTQFPADVIKIVSGSDGKIYSVPLDIHRANVLWYSKPAFAAAGITAAPTTWAEFEADAAKLKTAGITPLAVGDGGGIWVVGMIFETILIAQLGATGFDGLWTGATKWTDPKVTASLTELNKVLAFENTDHGSMSWDQAADLLIPASAGAAPTAAMTIMGDWANGEFQAKNFTDYGWAPAPANTGVYQALADSFPLPVKATNPAGAKALLTFMASATGQDIFDPYKGAIPANIKAGNPPATAAQYSDYQKSALADWTNAATVVVPSMEHGAAAAPAWKGDVEDTLTTFLQSGDVAAAQAALVVAAKNFVK
jgi:glucose/mannose transport system substrate-binding protein